MPTTGLLAQVPVAKYLDHLPLYRQEAIFERAGHVIARFDFDPAGLMMARSIPASRFEGYVLPDQAWLEAACDSPQGRQLCDRQVGVFGAALDAASEPLTRERWQFMKSLASAVAQEGMRAARSGW